MLKEHLELVNLNPDCVERTPESVTMNTESVEIIHVMCYYEY